MQQSDKVPMYLSTQFSSVALGLYAFTMPSCKPESSRRKKSIASRLGLDALVLFKQIRMVIFSLFAMFLGAALQITNAFGSSFLENFNFTHPDSFGVKHSIVFLSITQMSATLFILTIPFFLRKFGIKKIMMISIFAWMLRFGLFSIGDPGSGLVVDLFTRDGMRDWPTMYMVLAAYALVLGLIFPFVFNHKHKTSDSNIHGLNAFYC